MVAWLDHVRVESQPVAVWRRHQVDLFDVEAESVQPAKPFVDAESLVRGEGLLVRQLAPEALVATDDLLTGLVGVDVRRQADLGVDIEELADDVDVRDVEVVLALAVGELAVELSGLGVDEVGAERSGVAAEERVRQRAVAPEEAREVEPDEQLRAGVQQARAEVGDDLAREERPQRQ